MGRGISRVKKNIYLAAVVAVIVILLVFAVGCSGDLLGYIKNMIEGECRGIIDLPKTGQTSSEAAGDDGNLQKGVAWPFPRFTDNGDTITDNLTGLMWDKTGNRFGTSTWEQALIDCNGLDLGGHTDWRLPNRKELRSLVNYEEPDQATWLNAIGTFAFDNVQADYYWSSTTRVLMDTAAWYVSMNRGEVTYNGKTVDAYVLAVQAGQTGGAVSLPRTGQTATHATGDDGDLDKGVAWPSPRFTDNGDGIICDKLTGFMWEQALSGIQRNWTDALTYANNLNLGGHSDWRLPNVNELGSLINADQVDLAAWLNGQGFSSLPSGHYWSSTNCLNLSSPYAWHIVMGSGGVYFNDKADSKYVLAVRSGQ